MVNDGVGGSRSRSCGGVGNIELTEVSGALDEAIGGGQVDNVGGEGCSSTTGQGDVVINPILEDAMDGGVGVDDVFGGVELSISGGGGESQIGEGAEVVMNVSGGGGETGAEEAIGEREKGGSIGEGDNGVNNGGGADEAIGGAEEGDGVSVGGGEDGAVGGDGGSGGNGMDVGGDRSGNNVHPIPLIPRWRLREILAHAEGECIVLLC